MADYMGRAGDVKRAWMLNFIAKLQSSGSVYAVLPPDVAAISAAVNKFVAALAVVQTPSGRNVAATSRKNDARAAAEAICRQYVRLIKYNAGISDGAKLAAGIKPPIVTSPVARPCPLSAPTLSIVAATNGAQTLTYADTLAPGVRRKPDGADGLMLFRAITDDPVRNIAQAQLYRKYTTSPMVVFFDPADRCKSATYFGRWIGQKGDMSTPSAPVSMTIAA